MPPPVVYTTVEFKIVAPIIDAASETPLDDKQVLMTVEVPPLPGPNSTFNLPTKITKKLSLGQTIKLRLLPSDFTIPQTRYKVTYTVIGKPSQVLYRQEWVVPYPKLPKTQTLRTVPSVLVYPLPEDFESLIELKVTAEFAPPLDYRIEGKVLTFITPPPDLTLLMQYACLTTLAEIVYEPKQLANANYSRNNINGVYTDRDYFTFY